MEKISELLETAAGRAVPVLAGIDDNRLGDPTPCTEYDVRTLINHLFQVVVNFHAHRRSPRGAEQRRAMRKRCGRDAVRL
ncbi:hypothetical protein ACFU8Q_03970 [Streptomyces sp. NPDC057543]|uniref:hypothetical protein n=1 Tax=Streptomyces sp. NPDC057543 TaxID=3346163 RepID=UPI003678D789